MSKVLVTGGAGFIGSHIVDALLPKYAGNITVLDKMTYAADYRNIAGPMTGGQVHLVVGDICDHDVVHRAMQGVDLVIHAAAESHVDNSFQNSVLFSRSNVLGTHNLLESARQNKVRRFVHVSTDEVYGEIVSGEADEACILAPTNPYSASKAAAEMIALGYVKSFQQPIIVARGNNVFGKRQFPEKLIPKSILYMMLGRPVPIHGNGKNRRHYLAAEDMAAAIVYIAETGKDFEIYNIASEDEYENVEVVGQIAAMLGKKFEDVVAFIEDRPFNDRRYAINARKLHELGWRQKHRFTDRLPSVVRWYQENVERYQTMLAPRVAVAS